MENVEFVLHNLKFSIPYIPNVNIHLFNYTDQMTNFKLLHTLAKSLLYDPVLLYQLQA